MKQLLHQYLNMCRTTSAKLLTYHDRLLENTEQQTQQRKMDSSILSLKENPDALDRRNGI